jgi:hypothetical protein
VTRRSRALLAVPVLITLLVQVAHAVPRRATSGMRAVSGCLQHCRKLHSFGAASRCCGVDLRAGDPGILVPPTGHERPAARMVVVVSPALGKPAVPALHATAAGAYPRGATGPPLFLRLLTLVL